MFAQIEFEHNAIKQARKEYELAIDAAGTLFNSLTNRHRQEIYRLEMKAKESLLSLFRDRLRYSVNQDDTIVHFGAAGVELLWVDPDGEPYDRIFASWDEINAYDQKNSNLMVGG